MQTNPTHSSLVAVGDSFTEGMSDLLPDGSYRGWADLLAGRMAAQTPGFRYANLAVRGKLIGQIVDEQVDVAAAMGADGLYELVHGRQGGVEVGIEGERLPGRERRVGPVHRRFVRHAPGPE
ncbi:SGNH/GDSL hydrolase family protein, partial [Streptomyces nigra]